MFRFLLFNQKNEMRGCASSALGHLNIVQYTEVWSRIVEANGRYTTLNTITPPHRHPSTPPHVTGGGGVVLIEANRLKYSLV